MKRGRIWMVRVGATIGGLAYIALAIGNGLDRLALDRHAKPNVVPALFATNALEVAGEAALPDNPRAANALAERLVARAPVEPFSTALLGASRAALGDDVGADRAFRVAGQLGWRVPVTQSYWLAAALAVGNNYVAAQRLDALLRQRPDLLRLPETMARFESNAAARDALVGQMTTRPPWLEQYAGATDPTTPAAVMVRRLPTLMLLGERGIVLGCAAIAPALAELTGAGMTGEAAALRRRHCPGASQ